MIARKRLQFWQINRCCTFSCSFNEGRFDTKRLDKQMHSMCTPTSFARTCVAGGSGRLARPVSLIRGKSGSKPLIATQEKMPVALEREHIHRKARKGKGMEQTHRQHNLAPILTLRGVEAFSMATGEKTMHFQRACRFSADLCEHVFSNARPCKFKNFHGKPGRGRLKTFWSIQKRINDKCCRDDAG